MDYYEQITINHSQAFLLGDFLYLIVILILNGIIDMRKKMYYKA